VLLIWQAGDLQAPTTSMPTCRKSGDLVPWKALLRFAAVTDNNA